MRWTRVVSVLAAVLLLVGVAPADEQWVPIAAHTPGLGGSLWQTEVRALNVCETTIHVTLRMQTTAGALTHQLTVSGGGQTVLDDVVSMLTPDNVVGAVAIETAGELLISSRTYDANAPMRFGQVFEAVRAADAMGAGDVAILQNLDQYGGFRCNIGMTNIGDEDARARVVLFDELGLLVSELSYNIAPGTTVRENQPYTTRGGRSDVRGGFARVIVDEGDAVFVFASVVDGATGDAATVLAKPAPACDTGWLMPLDLTVAPQRAQELVCRR